MNGRLKRLLAVSVVVSMFVVSAFSDIGIKNADAATTIKIKKVKITVADKKTIKAPKSENKATWSVLCGKKNITILGKDKKTIKIKAEKSGKVKLQAKQGKKKTIYNITVEKHAPKKSEIKKLKAFYKEYFVKRSKEMGNNWYDERDDLLSEKWITWDDYGYIRGISLQDTDIFTEFKLPSFKRIKYFGSFWGMEKLERLDLGNNPTLECVFLQSVDVLSETYYSNFKEINVSGCKNLQVFVVANVGEQLKEMDLSSNDKLQGLKLSCIRGLKKLKLPDTDSLKEIVIRFTKLESLDIEKYTNLNKIAIEGNEFETVRINLENKKKTDIKSMIVAADNNLKIEFISGKNNDETPNIIRDDDYYKHWEVDFSKYVVSGYKMPDCW